jgi:hypothetical protein
MNYSKSRRKKGRGFAVTVGLSDIYERGREDFLDYFDGVETYCVCVERHKNTGNKESDVSKYHLHAYLRLECAAFLEEVGDVVRSFVEGTVNVQSCRRERNWLKNISKEDERPYFNCAVDKLSFRYRCLFWAKNPRKFEVDMQTLINLMQNMNS